MKFSRQNAVSLLTRIAFVLVIGTLIFHFQLSQLVDAAAFTRFGWLALVGAAILSLAALALFLAQRKRGLTILFPLAGLALALALLVFYFPGPQAVRLDQLVSGDFPLAKASVDGARQTEEQSQALWQEWSSVRWQPLAPDWSPSLMLSGKGRLDWGKDPVQFLFYPANGGGQLIVELYRYDDHYAVVCLKPSWGKESAQLYYSQRQIPRKGEAWQ